MRRLRYQVAASLDGFIAGPGGNNDWIVMDSSIDFEALFGEFDAAVMGRKTYEGLVAQGGNGALPGLDVVVFSRSLAAMEREGIRITGDDPGKVVAELKAKPGRDIWLFGGGELFRSLLDAGLVDTVEVAVMPVLLGDGIRLLPTGGSTKLVLGDYRVLPDSGIIVLSYRVRGSRAPGVPIRFVKARKGATHATKKRVARKHTPHKRTRSRSRS